MSARPSRRTTVALLAGAFAACAACTPIAARDGANRVGVREREMPAAGKAAALDYDPTTRPLLVGEAAPDVGLADAAGRRITLSEPRDEVTVLTFVSGEHDGPDGELLARLARFARSLATSVAGETRILCVELGNSPDAPLALPPDTAASDQTWPPCTFVRTAAEDSPIIAGAFGIAVWHSPDGAVQHTFNTVVLDRRGHLADQFPGLDGWSAMDLAAAVSLVARR